MKRLTLAVIALTLLVAPPLLAADSQTLNGEFIWERDEENIVGDLKAVFEPTGENTWNVAFYFHFNDDDHIYTGTAKGNLTDGELEGEVMSDDDEPHPYSFTGTFAADGSFSGIHHYAGGDEPARTGTITLGR